MQENKHPQYASAKEIYDVASKILNEQRTIIFSSFFTLLNYLDKNTIPYTIILRSFGPDAAMINEELKIVLHKDFIKEFDQIKRGVFITEEGEKDLYNYLKNGAYHFSIRDDWEYWYTHHENGQFGKRFPIDLQDSSRLSLFFDDNAKIDPDRPEHNSVAPYDVNSGLPISVQELMEKNRIFAVEPLAALCDQNYFIRLLEKALTTD